MLGQLGNRVQHALRAFTPDDAAALAKAVQTYPKTADYDLAEDLQKLGTGEAIITVLSESGAPTPVAWARMRAPRSLMAQIDAGGPAAGGHVLAVAPKYGTPIDRESAYEKLKPPTAPPRRPTRPDAPGGPAAPERPRRRRSRSRAKHDGLGAREDASSRRPSSPSPARPATVLGREITRGIFGTRRR